MNNTIGPLQILEGELDITRNPKYLFMGGFVDFTLQELVLFKADALQTELSIAFDVIRKFSKTTPDFSRLEIANGGSLIKLGNFEISSSTILYELDLGYKKYLDINRMIN